MTGSKVHDWHCYAIKPTRSSKALPLGFDTTRPFIHLGAHKGGSRDEPWCPQSIAALCNVLTKCRRAGEAAGSHRGPTEVLQATTNHPQDEYNYY